MAERMNGTGAGTVSYRRPEQGTDLRGYLPTPAPHKTGDFAFQEQSRQSKAEILEKIRKRQREKAELLNEELGIGNRSLPAFAIKSEFVATVETHKAIIAGGETGSGKSTQFPQYLYEAGYDLTIVLVPRRVIADGLGERIREEMSGQIEGFNAEETIGIIHGERVERHENNRIMVMTPNTYIKMAKDLREQFGDKKVAIIADEIHEANLFTEIAVGVAGESVEAHEDWRLIAASATHNSKTLQAPFEKLNGGEVPTIEIQGRPFEVERREEPEMSPMQAYATHGVDHEKSMIFTCGKKEIEHAINETRRQLEAYEKGSSEKVIFRVLHGELTETELSHINDPIPEGYRLVIVSSPAGMSGITIPGVTLVLTDGTINRAELDDDNAEGLRRHYLSKAGITQQIGRAGRNVPGGVGILCAPISTEKPGHKNKPIAEESGEEASIDMVFKSFDEREEHEPPEIYSTQLSRVVLSVAALDQSFDDLNERIPHPVQKLSIGTAKDVLAHLGALDDDDRITAIGRLMDKFPVTPELARGLVETMRHKRSLLHMARAAFIASAVDVGGLQDHHADEDAVRLRKQLIRDTTSDDYIAQLDLMMKLFERTSEEDSGYEFVERHGLHPKKVERVRKSARKIMSVMNMRLEHLVITQPQFDEEQQLRNDFTAGVIDNTFEDTGNSTRAKKAIYQNIHKDKINEDKPPTPRTISDRSVSTIPRGQLVAGIPRWYEKTYQGGRRIKHDIIDLVLPVDPAVVGAYAKENGIIQHVQTESRMEGDQAVDYWQGTFGTIAVGGLEKRITLARLSQRAQNMLVKYSLENKGETQAELRKLADTLEGYRQRTPANVLEALRNPGTPGDITQETITKFMRNAAKNTTTARELDAELRKVVYGANLTLEKYYHPESIQLLNEMSPDQLTIGDETLTVRYDNGQPYVTNLTQEQLQAIHEPIYLKDGREVLRQRQAAGGGKERVSFGESGVHVATFA